MIQVVRVGFVILFAMLVCLNVQVRAKNPPLRTLLPGTSLASLQLQKETLPKVLAAATVGKKSCKTPFVIQTTVIQGEGNTSWQELWTVNTCGESKTIPVQFMTHVDTGTEDLVSWAKNR